ncbi:hypothetical protein M7I_0007 [Glarea lozoyensis 74030]|uniref:Uncharacterized protein n=1 Tax=Glarea lozoyensis (strain ATCC 74030 / MF5533) TaxID=1104152 RepID=H0EC74_GLAL7|nr:hypothetical protein M7I_0007 [Glarea lozoyensis 74030]
MSPRIYEFFIKYPRKARATARSISTSRRRGIDTSARGSKRILVGHIEPIRKQDLFTSCVNHGEGAEVRSGRSSRHQRL